MSMISKVGHLHDFLSPGDVPFSRGSVPVMSSVIGVRELDLDQLFESVSRWVMDSNDEFFGVGMVGDWAAHYSVILSSNASLEIHSPMSGFLAHIAGDVLSVEPVVGFHGLVKVIDIVVSHVLHSSSGHGIVVLVDAHPVKHVVFEGHNLLQFELADLLINHSLRILSVRSVHISLTVSHLLLGRLSGGEVSHPAVHWIVAVREHVPVVDRPGDVLGLYASRYSPGVE